MERENKYKVTLSQSQRSHTFPDGESVKNHRAFDKYESQLKKYQDAGCFHIELAERAILEKRPTRKSNEVDASNIEPAARATVPDTEDGQDDDTGSTGDEESTGNDDESGADETASDGNDDDDDEGVEVLDAKEATTATPASTPVATSKAKPKAKAKSKPRARGRARPGTKRKR